MKTCNLRVNEQRKILHEIRKRKANWIGHILRRNCLLKQVIEGKIKREIEVTKRRGRRRKKLLNDLKDRRGYSHLKDRAMWRNRFRGGFGPVVRRNTEWMNDMSLVRWRSFCKGEIVVVYPHLKWTIMNDIIQYNLWDNKIGILLVMLLFTYCYYFAAMDSSIKQNIHILSWIAV